MIFLEVRFEKYYFGIWDSFIIYIGGVESGKGIREERRVLGEMEVKVVGFVMFFKVSRF